MRQFRLIGPKGRMPKKVASNVLQLILVCVQQGGLSQEEKMSAQIDTTLRQNYPLA
jgi:hypothetical protein